MISKKFIPLVLCLSAVGLTTACGSSGYRKTPDMEEARYWQRKNASSALYLRGPKAQQMLHKDISLCTHEIMELENLGEIREAIPAYYASGNTLEERTASQKELDEWDTPERDGYLYNEHLDYTDFETCMVAKGWQRMEYLPYDVADRARHDYLKRYGKKRYKKKGDREVVTTLDPISQNPPPYENVND